MVAPVSPRQVSRPNSSRPNSPRPNSPQRPGTLSTIPTSPLMPDEAGTTSAMPKTVGETANYIRSLEAPKFGVDRYIEERMAAGAGTRELKGSSRKGFIYGAGPYKGLTEGQAKERARAEYNGLNDRSRQRYESGAQGRDVMSGREVAREDQFYNARGAAAMQQDGMGGAGGAVNPNATPGAGRGTPVSGSQPTASGVQRVPPEPQSHDSSAGGFSASSSNGAKTGPFALRSEAARQERNAHYAKMNPGGHAAGTAAVAAIKEKRAMQMPQAPQAQQASVAATSATTPTPQFDRSGPGARIASGTASGVQRVPPEPQSHDSSAGGFSASSSNGAKTGPFALRSEAERRERNAHYARMNPGGHAAGTAAVAAIKEKRAMQTPQAPPTPQTSVAATSAPTPTPTPARPTWQDEFRARSGRDPSTEAQQKDWRDTAQKSLDRTSATPSPQFDRSGSRARVAENAGINFWRTEGFRRLNAHIPDSEMEAFRNGTVGKASVAATSATTPSPQFDRSGSGAGIEPKAITAPSRAVAALGESPLGPDTGQLIHKYLAPRLKALASRNNAPSQREQRSMTAQGIAGPPTAARDMPRR